MPRSGFLFTVTNSFKASFKPLILFSASTQLLNDPCPGRTILSEFPELKGDDIIANHVARYLDLLSLSKDNPAKVIGEKAKLVDKPGFEVEFISRNSLSNTSQNSNKINVLMPVKGHWKFFSNTFKTVLNPGDTFSVPEDLDYTEVRGLSSEVIEKLSKHRPVNLGQASRIQGITPAAISLLRIYLKKHSLFFQQSA